METQTAYARSMFSDWTNIAATVQVIVGLLALPEVRAIIPLTWMPAIVALSGALTVILRTWTATHPVAAISPNQVRPVEVTKLTATQQGTETGRVV